MNIKTKLLAVLFATFVIGGGIAGATSQAGEDALLAQSWTEMQTASLYQKYKSQNKNEAARVEAYWANGGTVPIVATAMGKALVLEAQAYWSLKEVPPPPPPAPTASLSANPTSINSGQNSVLTWSSTNATSCTASGAWSGTKATSGSQSVTPTSDSVYNLACTGSGGTANASANVVVNTPPPPPPAGCDLNATTSNFAAQVSAATSGQTVCLATGNYGQFQGTNKAITIKNAQGATPNMSFNFGSGDANFTLDGMNNMSGNMVSGAQNITIKNSVFTGTVDVDGSSTDGIVFDGNKHNWMVGPSSGGPNAKLYLSNGLTGTLASPSVTVKNSEFRNGDLDGIHFGGGSGYQILNNTFSNLCDMGANHTDNMQFDTSNTTNVRIAGNYVFAPAGCGTQGITSYDHGTNGVIIENNVVDIRRPWGIELYSDTNSIVRDNTVVWYPASQCDFNTPCGRIGLDRKSSLPAGIGTQAYNNLASVEFANGSTGTADHNVWGINATYVGPLTNHDGFVLSPTSPVGKGAARDGTDVGVYPN